METKLFQKGYEVRIRSGIDFVEEKDEIFMILFNLSTVVID